MNLSFNELAKLTDAVLTECGSRDTWLQERTKSLGGSDSPTLFGVQSKWSSPLSLWASKVAPVVKKSTPRLQAGLDKELEVLTLANEKFGGNGLMWPAHTIARRPDIPYVHATPDAVIFSDDHPGPGSRSIKTWSIYDRKAWAEVPPAYSQIQHAQELAVMGWQWGDIIVAFIDNDYETVDVQQFPMERNDYFIAELFKACGEFWRFVKERIEPPVDESRATAEALYQLHPDDNGELLLLGEDADAILLQLAESQAMADAAELTLERCKNQLRAMLGDNTFGRTPEHRYVSWKTQEKRSYVVKEQKNRVLRIHKGVPKALQTRLPAPPVRRQIEAPKPKGPIPDWVKNLRLGLGNQCACGATVTTADGRFDFLIPPADGGTFQPANISIACASCRQKLESDATLTVEAIAQ